jgi:hypothetical protein
MLLLPALLLAQAQTTGSVTGQVVNETGAPVTGAEVTLSGPAIQGERTLRTNSAGQFTAHLLPPGQYTATITSAGLQPAVYTFRVLVGETFPLNVTLQPGDVMAEEIVVHGRVSPLQTTETGRTFDYVEEVEELPIQNRNINNIALMAPNTSFGPNQGTAPQVAISGAPAFDTVVLLDGAEISDPYFGNGTTVYIEDAVQEVQVLTTGISARYGRFQGGVINAITKSGGNEYNGTLRIELDNQSWNSQTPFEETLTDKLNQTYQATVGGYVLRDRIWFFGGYRTIPVTTTDITTTVTGDAFAQTADETRAQLKLRGAITASQTVEGSYLEYESAVSDWGTSGLAPADPAARGARGDKRDMTSLTYQGVFGASTFADLAYTKKDVQITAGGDPAGADPFLWTPGPNWMFNNHWWDASDVDGRDNQTAALTLGHHFLAFGGNHSLQGGVQWVESSTSGDNRQSATGYNLVSQSGSFNPRLENGVILFDLLPGNATRWVALDLQATNMVENTALFVHDTIDFNKFRLDLGLRYDTYKGRTTGVQTFDLDSNDIAPRLGLTYNVTDQVQVVATWGKYIGRFNDNWAQDATGVASAPRSSWTYSGPARTGLTAAQVQTIIRDDSQWTFLSLTGDPDFPTTWVADSAHSPSNTELNLSMRVGLPRNSGFASVTYTARDYDQLMTAYTGLPCTDYGHCEGGDYAAIPSGGETDSTVWANEPRSSRTYNSVALQADYRPTARLSVGGNWTWSETLGNYEGEAGNQPAVGSNFGYYERAIQIANAQPYGYLNPHVRHRAVGYATYNFDFGGAGRLALGGIVNYRTGRVWSKTAAVPLASVPEYKSEGGTYTYYFDGRGNNEFPSVWSLDTSLRYELPLFAGLAPFVKLDVRNVLDNDALITYNTSGRAVAVNNANGTFSHWTWAPQGNCGPEDEPSNSCTAFGRISSQNNYQVPRTFLISAGIQF